MSGDTDANELRTVYAQQLARHDFPDNTITNSKYTFFTFLPKNLMEQFSLNFNRYFLFIALLQLEPTITPVNPVTTWAPLVIIFSISACKAFLDDQKKKAQDRLANNLLQTVIRNGQEQQIPSFEIRVGDLVKVQENEGLPCDLALVQSSNPKGFCYVQTSNLDGESDLKPRRALVDTQEMKMGDFRGVLEGPAPNNRLYSFNARMWLDAGQNGKPLSLSGDQLLQQGISIRNTEWIVGVAVYTGNETKFGQNKADPPLKVTKTEVIIDKLSTYLFIFQLLLVLLFGTIGEAWRQDIGRHVPYLQYGADTFISPFIVPLRFLLLNSTIIPISLKVALDLSKLYYSRFIQNDVLLWDHEINEGVLANNTSISEDLGQIEYILSDKTGTLTCNVMVFKECTIKGKLYEATTVASGEVFASAIAKGEDDITDYYRNFALNNSCVPTLESKTANIIYKGSSPDEIALVNIAAEYGVVLTARDGEDITITVNGVVEHYVLLKELAFTSARKRMSVIVKNKDTGALRMYVKGADEVLTDKLADSEAKMTAVTLDQVEAFAVRGLRTLFYCYRDFSEPDYAAWKQVFDTANETVGDSREARVEEAFAQIETDFLLQGASAIEDKLQALVPESIAILRRAGIHFWMLTGDKFSTAVQIAHSTNLKTNDAEKSQLYEITGEDEKAIQVCLEEALQHMSADEKKNYVEPREYTTIIRGTPDLRMALEHHQELFSELALRCNSVICCRVSPRQKAELVELVRAAGKMTLAVGDGGNDVSMIQAAHIGVGIRGKEGMQAARAADYTVSWFSALVRLTLVHGRYSYVRTALVAQYSFYKSFMFCVIQILYNSYAHFSGVSLFNTATVTAYNAVLFFPTVTFVTWRDVSMKAALAYPSLYIAGARDALFNKTTILMWLLRGLVQGIIVLFFTVAIRDINYTRVGTGFAADYETMGFIAFGGYLFIQSFTMMLELTTISRVSMGYIWFFHWLTFLGMYVTSLMISFQSLNEYYAFRMAFLEKSFWLASLLMTVTCVGPVVFYKAVMFNFYPSRGQVINYCEKRGDDLFVDMTHNQFVVDEMREDMGIGPTGFQSVEMGRMSSQMKQIH